jgi:hypothetical protein
VLLPDCETASNPPALPQNRNKNGTYVPFFLSICGILLCRDAPAASITNDGESGDPNLPNSSPLYSVNGESGESNLKIRRL